jgi:hypothetical protein
MGITHNLKKIATVALVSGAVAVAGLGLAAGTAEADPQSSGPFQWCPGQPLPEHPGGSYPPTHVSWPATHVVWDDSVCHTYWRLTVARGNVRMNDGAVSDFWDGPDPPPYFEPVCVPFVPPINCRPQNG